MQVHVRLIYADRHRNSIVVVLVVATGDTKVSRRTISGRHGASEDQRTSKTHDLKYPVRSMYGPMLNQF